MTPPCNLDHNGECLICDCWPHDCAYARLLNQDYSKESKEELAQMFNDIIVCPNCNKLMKHTYPLGGKLYCSECGYLFFNSFT